MSDMNVMRPVGPNFGSVKGENFDLEASQVMFQEVLTLMLNEDVAMVHVLRDLINTTIGFERLAVKMNKQTQSVKRMLSDTGNPTCNNLMAILTVIRKVLNVQIAVTVVPAWRSREISVEHPVSIDCAADMGPMD
ncbi:MAG: hypothetical protein ACD_6C00644G0002 [uncultured bacterium]|nr:MAG: hypothetical protein ACD_6C00644G0002 [uncultured bacterium]